jgi:hypothetical protein
MTESTQASFFLPGEAENAEVIRTDFFVLGFARR